MKIRLTDLGCDFRALRIQRTDAVVDLERERLFGFKVGSMGIAPAVERAGVHAITIYFSVRGRAAP